MQNNNNQGFVKNQVYTCKSLDGITTYTSYTGQVDNNKLPHGKGMASTYRINSENMKQILYDVDGTFVHGATEGICTHTYYQNIVSQKRTGNTKDGFPHGYGLTEYGDNRYLYANSLNEHYEPKSQVMMYKLEGSQGCGTYFGTFSNNGMTIEYDHTKFIKGHNIPKQVFEMEL